jgi:4-alpha-glucanotransferase
MLGLSARYHALPETAKTPAMLHELYEAQANDAYWHGLFGGLYLPHLRRAIYNAIVRLEAMMDAAEPRAARSQADLDLDGNDELFLQNGLLQAVVKLDGSASICEFDAYKLAHNFGDTLARQTEHYHRRVNAQQDHGPSGGGIANPHERMVSKHEIVAADLATDAHARTLFRDAWAEREGARYLPVTYGAASGGRTAAVTFEGQAWRGMVSKKLTLKDNSLQVAYQFTKLNTGLFRVEINLAMPSCDGPAGRFRIGDDIPGGFGQPLHLDAMKDLWLEDDVLGGRIKLRSNVAGALNAWPHFSVSQSEAGFEKIMQAVTLELVWPMSAIGKGLEIQLEVS